MKFHPYAEVFPLLEGAAFEELIADIKTFGLREKIWVYEDKILDGRNRYLACQKAKVKPLFRTFKGTLAGALALVVSANLQRRQLTDAQKAFAGARISELRAGDNQYTTEVAARAATSQAEISEKIGTSPDSIQRAKKVLRQGSAALQKAAESGEVPLKKAAAVVNLPKSEQLSAARAKPAPKPEPSISEGWEPEIDEDDRLAAIEREQDASLQKLLDANDKLAIAYAEIKRQAAEIATLKLSRDGYMNQCGELVRRLKNLQRKLEKQAA